MTNALQHQASRRGFLRLTGTIGLAAGLAASLAACAPDEDGTDAAPGTAGSGGGENENGTITAAISYELGTNGYDPMTTTAALTVAANWHTMEGLTELDPATREVYAALATELPSVGDGETSVDVTLRDGAVFHDGTPVTAEDVVYSFERVLDPENASLYAGFIPFVSGVTAKDEKTVTIELAYPVGVLAERLSVVKIVPRAAASADAEAFDANPVGTGPWKMTDNGGVSKVITFERNDAYTGPRPARAATMTWQVIPDPATRTNALQSGSVQAIDSVPYLSIDQLKASSTVESVQGFGLLFAMFNRTEGNPFADVRARQAFLYALDMDTIIATGLTGQADAATSFVHKEHPAHQDAKVVYSLDADKAKALFEEAGVSSFRVLATNHDWVKQCTPIIVENLKAVGVDVQFEEKQSADAYTTIDGNPEAFDVLIAPGDPSVFGNDADLLLRWWYGSDLWTDSRMHWKGTESYETVQQLLDEGLRATDQQAQMDAWHQIFDLVSEEVPLYPLFHRKAPTAWDDESLVDFAPIALTGLSFVGVGTTK
ncbi:ABC transporter substrate-binding protein [Ornithinimicrobium humiphilum]|uniref:Peptide/nickel transport system substrate-binding protein n=1 Tax=Ornithinimicrobium humiphilum TaxID=125288 RepID=A0A543K7R9_9MICO|nr:ABC transporter substrate-binding protein [Ornithinimicrobium humiphilum]TQM91115.1 peptide/nickel transport system substrate-binding protein [Ornithinimicrobium humiphilum]